jgi:hypothetical protein
MRIELLSRTKWILNHFLEWDQSSGNFPIRTWSVWIQNHFIQVELSLRASDQGQVNTEFFLS